MNQRIVQLLNAGGTLGALIGAAILSQGCSGTTDPGVCYTSGDFPTSQVTQDYAIQICVDWVNLLLSNCVQINNLSLNPTQAEVGAYCGSGVVNSPQDGSNGYPGYGDSSTYSFQIQHTCDFVDNPNVAVCGQYTTAPVSISSVKFDLAFISGLNQQIASKATLSESAKNTRIYVEGTLINVGTGTLDGGASAK